jgi:hypothetical protein
VDLAGYRPTITEVAALFGKSGRWISDLRAKGELPEDGATLGEFVSAWVSYATSTSGVKAKPIDAAKARRELAKAEREEMQTAAMKGELLPRAGVTSAVQNAFARVRARLLALPNKAAPLVVTLKEVVPIQEKLTELVHEALAELSATTVGIEANRAGAGDAPGDVGGDRAGSPGVVAGADAAPAVDGQPVGRRKPGAKPGRQRRTG